MDVTQQYFVDLLSWFVNDNEPVGNANVDWEEILRLAGLHSVAGIIGYTVKKLPQEDKPEANVAEKLSNQLYSTFINFTKKEFAMQSLMAEFDKECIPRLLIKGFVLKDYYPVKELRTFGDIDILIKREDRQRAHALMLRLNYNAKVDHGEVWEYTKPGEYYEIHTQLVSDAIAPNASGVGYFENAWDNAVNADGGYTYHFTKECHLLYLLQHIAKHMNGNGAGIRMFMDIAVYLRHFKDLDWDYIWTELDKLGLRRFSGNVFALCNAWFGIEAPFELIKLSPEFYNQMCDYVISAGTFGFYGRNHATFQVRKELKSGKTENFKGAVKWKALRSYLFPSYSEMKVWYTFLEGKPVLLPFAWFIRSFKVFTNKRKKSAAHVGDIMTGTDEAIEQFNLLSQLGLTNKK